MVISITAANSRNSPLPFEVTESVEITSSGYLIYSGSALNGAALGLDPATSSYNVENQGLIQSIGTFGTALRATSFGNPFFALITNLENGRIQCFNGNRAIDADQNSAVINAGAIEGLGARAIEVRSTAANAGNQFIFNDVTGIIQSFNADTINYQVGGSHKILNYGLISNTNTTSSSYFAIVSSVGTEDIDNRGTIRGNVSLGGGNDVVDTSTGTINGIVLLGAGSDKYTGGAGNDVVLGEGDSDTLIGGAGNDRLDGGAGADVMTGGTGNDTYVINSLADTFTEAANQGSDTIETSFGLSIVNRPTFENIRLVGSAAINATGNALTNILIGETNSAANNLTGLSGNDLYFVGAGDKIIETASGGTDTVASSSISLNLGLPAYANVERIVLQGSLGLSGTGNSGANVIGGNNGNNFLTGLGGNDALNGALGSDTLTGGVGLDSFIFNTALGAFPNIDSIIDFSVVDDRILLDNAIFTALGAATGAMTSAQFWASASGLAHDANDRIVYNTATGVLSYDADGNGVGSAIHFATLVNKAALTSADFLII